MKSIVFFYPCCDFLWEVMHWRKINCIVKVIVVYIFCSQSWRELRGKSLLGLFILVFTVNHKVFCICKICRRWSYHQKQMEQPNFSFLIPWWFLLWSVSLWDASCNRADRNKLQYLLAPNCCCWGWNLSPTHCHWTWRVSQRWTGKHTWLEALEPHLSFSDTSVSYC